MTIPGEARLDRRTALACLVVAPLAMACGSAYGAPSRLSERERQLTAIKADLEATLPRIDALEAELRERGQSLDASQDQIEAYRARIAETEARYPRGIPAHLYPAYSQDVDQHNALVRWHNQAVREYDARYATYAELVAYYNRRVEEHNAIVRELNGSATNGRRSAGVLPPLPRRRFRR